jgi:hypothetical protein
MGLNPQWDGHKRTHKLIDYHDGKFQTFAFMRRFCERFVLTRIPHLVAPASRRRISILHSFQKRRRDAGATKPFLRFTFFERSWLLLELIFAVTPL